MTTSKSGIGLHNPVPGERIPIGTLGYFQARNKRNAYDLVMAEFEASGITQAELTRRLGLGADRVCRMLAGPGNWTLDTFSDLLFAISGAAPLFGKDKPLSRPRRNQRGPDWLYRDDPREPSPAESKFDLKPEVSKPVDLDLPRKFDPISRSST